MGGAPILVTCYRNGIDSYGTWITDATALTRVRALAAEGGESLVADVIWHEREPWTKRITSAWPAVDTFNVSLAPDRGPVVAAAPRGEAPFAPPPSSDCDVGMVGASRSVGVRSARRPRRLPCVPRDRLPRRDQTPSDRFS